MRFILIGFYSVVQLIGNMALAQNHISEPHSAPIKLNTAALPIANDRVVTGVTFKGSKPVAGKTLVLNGVGLRLATIFNVKVYAAGLYTEVQSKLSKTFLDNSNMVKHLALHFLRDVEREKMVEAWTNGFRENCVDKKCEELKVQLDQLNSAMVSIKEGQWIYFTFEADGLSVEATGKPIVKVMGPALWTKSILSIFIGKNPPNSELKEGLLGARI